MAVVCTVFIINARNEAANLSSRRGRLKKPKQPSQKHEQNINHDTLD